MANANNERSNDIRENVLNGAEQYYEQKYHQIGNPRTIGQAFIGSRTVVNWISWAGLNDQIRIHFYVRVSLFQILKLQRELMDSEHDKLLKDENFMERLVLDITEFKKKQETLSFHVDHFQTYET